MPDMDITKNIKAIEALKCALLADIAGLYEQMRKPLHQTEYPEQMAGMLIHMYLLAGRLGINYDTLDQTVLQRLRREMLEGHYEYDVRGLLAYWCNER